MTVRKGKGKATPGAAPPARRKWLIPVAVATVVLCGYAFYFLDNLPQSQSIRPGTSWRIEPGEQLRLHGAGAGTVLQLNFGGQAAAKLSAPPGARRTDSPDARGPFEFSLFNAERENAEIAVRLAPAAGAAKARLIVEPRFPDPNLMALRLRAEEATLDVGMGLVFNPGAAEHGRIELGEEVLEEVALSVPAGETVTIGLRTEQLGALRKEVGELEDSAQRLLVEAVEIGTDIEGDFEQRWLACGAPRGKVLWQRPLPRLSLGDCGGRRLAVVGLDLSGEGGRVSLQGAGYTVTDGDTAVWKGFREFRQNDIVRSILGSLIVALLGWVGAVLWGRKKR